MKTEKSEFLVQVASYAGSNTDLIFKELFQPIWGLPEGLVKTIAFVLPKQSDMLWVRNASWMAYAESI